MCNLKEIHVQTLKLPYTLLLTADLSKNMPGIYTFSQQPLPFPVQSPYCTSEKKCIPLPRLNLTRGQFEKAFLLRGVL